MKNSYTGKTATQILSVLTCAAVLIMLACCFAPYYTITEPYHFILNRNPMPDHYSLVDVMWIDPSVVNEHFSLAYANFEFNDYVTNLVLSFIFGIATVVTSLWFAYNEFKRYPSTVSAVFMHICAILWSIFTLAGYLDNDMLDLGVAKFMPIRTVIIVLTFVGTALMAARLVVWILTEIKLAKEKKARLALL